MMHVRLIGESSHAGASDDCEALKRAVRLGLAAVFPNNEVSEEPAPAPREAAAEYPEESVKGIPFRDEYPVFRREGKRAYGKAAPEPFPVILECCPEPPVRREPSDCPALEADGDFSDFPHG